VVQRVPFEAQNALRVNRALRLSRESAASLKTCAARCRRRARAPRRLEQIERRRAQRREPEPRCRPFRPRIKRHGNSLRNCCRNWAIWQLGRRTEARRHEPLPRALRIMVQRIQQELNGLASGSARPLPPPAARGQPEFLNQSYAACRARNPASRWRASAAPTPSNA